MNKKMKIIQATPIIEKHNHNVGEIISDYKTYMHLVCKGGYLDLEEIKYEGKKKMLVKDFLNGMGAKMRIAATQ
jgi:methionyl-tRNA formyltransferase